MVQETKRFLSYICPHCAQSVIVERDLFSLAAAPAHIKCPCGKSELLVEFKPNRVQLTVPCLFCGREHTVSCSSHAFIREKALAFSCAASGLDCCYVGEEGPVYAATARLEQAVDKLRMDDRMERRGAFLDEVVMEETLAELKDIAARGGVKCACGSTDYGVKVGYSSVDLVCARCGAALRLSAASHDDLADLCARDALTIPGRKD